MTLFYPKPATRQKCLLFTEHMEMPDLQSGNKFFFFMTQKSLEVPKDLLLKIGLFLKEIFLAELLPIFFQGFGTVLAQVVGAITLGRVLMRAY